MKLAKYKYQYERDKAFIDDLNSIDGSIDVHKELEELTKETDLKYLQWLHGEENDGAKFKLEHVVNIGEGILLHYFRPIEKE
tara:strand:- start:540 stop:785 length:246 start_codon:yes stop_codon:yes gene_type:complete